MNKAKVLKILNPILFTLVLLQAASVIILKINSNLGILFEIHEYNGYAIGVVILLHIYFNWPWIKNTFFKKNTGQ